MRILVEPKRVSNLTRNSALGGLCLAFLVTACDRREPTTSGATANSIGSNAPVTAPISAAYGGSASCQSCHEEAFANWKNSHHALAERLVNPALDQSAFDPQRTIAHGTQSSRVQWSNGVPQFITAGLQRTNQTFDVVRVIGVNPLLQYLVAAPGGRLQATELCFDPSKLEWFNVYGAEDRQPGEWGHWTGRGMNWNNMCAVCHNTRFQKIFDATTDTYRSSFAEMGVGCEACHGPMADHSAWQWKQNPLTSSSGKPLTRPPATLSPSDGERDGERGLVKNDFAIPNQRSPDPALRPLNREQMYSVCAQCHARRGELTPDFQPGEDFFDHHALTIPDDTEIFYADGQIREEDYEFNAFLGSKMHAAGVRCVNCHEPHTAKVRLPGNYMCLSCHTGGDIAFATNALNTLPVGPRIDPATHSRHKVGERGDGCVDCHMPVTVYMQRHPRHDHGFTIPDPRLTKQFGIPNACNRCHTDKTVDWSQEFMVKWYGPRTNNTVLARTEAIWRARNGDARAVPGLLKLASESTNAYWRAVALNLLRPWSADTNVQMQLLRGMADTNALARAAAVRSLEPLALAGEPTAVRAVAQHLADSARNVRVDAAWALRRTLNTNSPAGRDLLAHLNHNADQPQGLMQAGVFQFERGDAAGAVAHVQQAIRWDPNSPPLYDTLAVMLSTLGRSAEAVDALKTAVRLAPNNADLRYRLGLAFNEIGDLNSARAALVETVRLDPRFVRAWYNLGLAQSALNQPDAAIESLVRAESLDANSPGIPYARATILARLGRVNEARAAARRALELDRNFAPASQLLQSLP